MNESREFEMKITLEITDMAGKRFAKSTQEYFHMPYAAMHEAESTAIRALTNAMIELGNRKVGQMQDPTPTRNPKWV